MKTVRSARVMSGLGRRWKRAGVRTAFVPTMGALHAGHMSLVERARREAGRDGVVVLSIYVNPTQFGPGEDLGKYPRDLARDRRLCREAGVDVLFVPPDGDLYQGDASTWVVEERLSAGMEGAVRPGHFRGVTTVVAKLLNLVQPEVVVFGAKDFQQAAVVRRMIRDLCWPLRMVVAPTRREADGLAMSSRNVYLSGEERAQAGCLFALIAEARRRVRSAGGGCRASVLKTVLRRALARYPLARLEYVEFFDPVTLIRCGRVWKGGQVALAVRLGKTRLIDNGRL